MPIIRSPLLLDAGDPINRGLVGFWPLDENSNGQRRDISTYRRNMASAAPPTPILSPHGRAVKFNGSTQYLQNSTFAWPGGQNAAISVWVNTAGGVAGSPWDFGGRTLVSGNAFYAHLPFSTNIAYFYYGAPSTGEISTDFSAYLNKWTHVVWTTSNSRKAIFINGRLITSSGTVSAAVAAGTNAYIGYSPVGGGYDNGAMRLFRLFNRPLTDTDAMRLYREPWAGVRRLVRVKDASTGISVALTGVSGTAAVGTLSPQTAVAVSGVAGTGEVGTVVPSLALALTGVEGLAVVGDVGIGGDKTVALTGVEATGAVGDVVGVLGGVSGTLRRRGRYRVYRDIPVELAPAVDLAAGYVEAEVERAVEDAMRRLRALSLKASVARRTALVQELNTQIVAAVARAAEADEEDAIALL